ncbi:MAG TPA: CBS domain-containing protein, partial [Acidimicrobiales bacterium]|nr:CBS domain-containing protein [Acidimicrobiales bacterium]
MTTDVLLFAPDDNVGDAMTALVERGIDGAPVVNSDNEVVGMLSTGDLIVQETELHVPTIISLFGATLELPSAHKHFEDDLRKTLGA